MAQVSDVLIDTVKLYGTTNGVRIKTWQVGPTFDFLLIFLCFSFMPSFVHLFKFSTLFCNLKMSKLTSKGSLLAEQF